MDKNTNFEAAKQFVDMKIKHGKESISGRGSHLKNTKVTIEVIDQAIADYEITSILDLGCGDWNWFQKVELQDCKYIGWDAHEKMIENNKEKYENDNVKFEVKDIVTEGYPQVDLIICRDVLFHLQRRLAVQCIDKIRSSCQFFISSSFNKRKKNSDIKPLHNWNWGFYKMNLNIPPFDLAGNCIKSAHEKRNRRFINLYRFIAS